MKKMKVIKLTVKDIVNQVPANGNQKQFKQLIADLVKEDSSEHEGLWISGRYASLFTIFK